MIIRIAAGRAHIVCVRFDDIGSVGFELWTVNAGSIFDNIFVADNLDAAFKHADEYRGVFAIFGHAQIVAATESEKLQVEREVYTF